MAQRPDSRTTSHAESNSAVAPERVTCVSLPIPQIARGFGRGARKLSGRWDASLRTSSCRMRSCRARSFPPKAFLRSEEHTSELQSHSDLVCRLLLEKKKQD